MTLESIGRLLSSSHKVELGEGVGILTRVLYLSPADESGANLCPWSSAGCRAACLGHSSGFMKWSTHRLARIRKSQLFMTCRAEFIARLHKEIGALVRKAGREGFTPAVRLNGSSDIPWERVAPGLFTDYPTVAFYDYTKSVDRTLRSLADPDWPANYRLTFSKSEVNDHDVARVLAAGGNVAAVFDAPESFPDAYLGVPVISGELHDYRYGDPQGVVVALKARGDGHKDTSGFVIRAAA